MAREALGERRIGHTGTLDPMAGGVLLRCVGRATRLQQHLLAWDKTYHGMIRFGKMLINGRRAYLECWNQ